MAAKPFVIAPFLDLSGVVEIIGIGRLRRQSGVALEAEIEVELLSLSADSSFDPEINVHRRWVGCGQLDLLTIGSRWERGRRTGTVSAEEHRGSYSFLAKEHMGLGSERHAERARFLPSRSSERALCFLLERQDAAAIDRGGPRKILLPYAELVRSLFGVSGRFLLQLMDGLRDPVALDRGIIDRSQSAVLKDGTVRLVCWRRPTAAKRPGELTSAPLDIVGAKTIAIDYFGKGGPPHPALSTLADGKSSEAEVSTASRTAGGDSEVGRVEVRRVSSGGNGPRLDQYRANSLRATMIAIEAAASSMGWKMTLYPASGRYLSGVTGGSFDFDREGILVGLNVSGRHMLIADSGTETGDRRSLGILVPTMARRVAEYDLERIRDAERNGVRWGSAATRLDGFEIHAVRRHPRVWKAATTYADLLRRRVEQASQSRAE